MSIVRKTVFGYIVFVSGFFSAVFAFLLHERWLFWVALPLLIIATFIAYRRYFHALVSSSIILWGFYPLLLDEAWLGWILRAFILTTIFVACRGLFVAWQQDKKRKQKSE